MKKIKNIYNKKLSFILGDEDSFSLNTQEEKTVPNDLAERLLRSRWIVEVQEEKKQEEIQEPIEQTEQEELLEEIQVEEEQETDEEKETSKKRKKTKKVEE